jgi:hypothetical protein
MDPERKRALKAAGKAEVGRRSDDLQGALSAANPAPIASDEWVTNYKRSLAVEKWLQRKRPLLRAKRLRALFVVQAYENDGWVPHPGAYVLCSVCGSAVPCGVPNRMLYWRSCDCGNITWRALLGWTKVTVRDRQWVFPIKLIGRGDSLAPTGSAEPGVGSPGRFTVRERARDKTPGADYEYEVFDAGRFVARYSHDFRGEEHVVEFADGRREEWPARTHGSFVISGWPFTLTLSRPAVSYLSQVLER